MMKRSTLMMVFFIIILLTVAVSADRLPSVSGEEPSHVLEFNLTATEGDWEIKDGLTTPIWGYDGQIYGPEIRVKEGDLVRINFKNELPVSTCVHWHGLHVPNEMDGACHVTQQPVGSFEAFTYEFAAKPSGSFIYHAHEHPSARQLDKGLIGPLMIETKNEEKSYDREFTLLLDEWDLSSAKNPSAEPIGMMGGMMGSMMGGMMSLLGSTEIYDTFTINGLAYPSTEPLLVKKGGVVKLRLINVGFQQHEIHIHGHNVRITHTDGSPLPRPQTANVITISPYERVDVDFVADNPGDWAIHCHREGHSENGMKTLIKYNGRTDNPKVPDMDNVLSSDGYPKYQGIAAGVAGPDGAFYDRILSMTISMMTSSGQMAWSINGKTWPNVDPFIVKEGERVKINIFNMSPEGHPMHLHGHSFTVTAINEQQLSEPWLVKDTLMILPMESYEISFVADNPGNWLFHCHQAHHMDHGLAALISYSAVEIPSIIQGAMHEKQEQPVELLLERKGKAISFSIKNNQQDGIYTIKIGTLDSEIRFIKAKGWDRERIDENNVILSTGDKPVLRGDSLKILVILVNPNVSLEWSVVNRGGIEIAEGAMSYS